MRIDFRLLLYVSYSLDHKGSATRYHNPAHFIGKTPSDICIAQAFPEAKRQK